MPESIHILLIDDNPRDRVLIVREIKREFKDVTVEQIIDQAALDQSLESGKYDLVVTDYQLGWSTGLNVLQRSKEQWPHCPVIMFTGTGNEEVAVEAMKQGLNDYILKSPAHYVRLPGAMRSALDSARQHQELTGRLTLLTGAVEQSRSIIIITDSQGDIEYVNPRFTEVTGYKLDEVIGQNPRILKSDKTELNYSALWQTVGAGKTWQGEFLNQKKNGEPFWAAATVTPMKDYDGDITHFLAVEEDISKQKEEDAERLRLEKRILEQTTQLSLILQTVPEGVVLLDAAGEIILANEIATNELKKLATLQEGRFITHLGDRSLANLLATPARKGLWHEIKTEQQTFEVIAQPVINGAEPENWVVMINDVTEAIEIREQLHQQERLSAVGQLATGIAHDFNNIIAVIMLYSQISMSAPGLPEKIHGWLTTIKEQSHHASNLIQQVLDFSRQAVLEQHPINMVDMLTKQIMLLKRALPENIELDLAYNPEVGYVVNADATRMQQMITNLALNARDAMPDGGTLHLSLERTDIEPGHRRPILEMEAGNWIKIIVRDTGTGMPPEVISRVFDPFYTTKGPGDGTGLGLAQVHGIVGQHGGHIHVHSTPNKGTSFTIYLPAWSHAPEAAPLNLFSEMPHGNGELILIVEDNDVLRLTLVESLTQLSYKIVEAANGNEAITLMKARGDEVALIVTDAVMPEMGGIPLLNCLRQQGWETPIIILSGHPRQKDVHDLVLDEVSQWLSKPIKLEDLAKVVAESIRTPLLMQMPK